MKPVVILGAWAGRTVIAGGYGRHMRLPSRRRRPPSPEVPYHPDYAAMGAFWMADDDELHAMIERLALTSRARGPEIGYLLAESDRRALRRANQQMVETSNVMARSATATERLTRVLVVLTLVLVVMTAVLIFLPE